MRITLTYLFFCLLLVATIVATLLIGDTPWSVAWSGALQKLNGISIRWNPLLDERIPRLIVLLCTGASLAVGGAVMQALFNNPLASPSILGISCGGSLIVIMVFIMEWHLNYPYAVPLAAFGGCLLTLLVVYLLTRYKGEVQIQNLILTGIAISTLLIAIQGAIMYSLRDRWQLIQMLTEWVAGSTADRTWKHVHMQLPLTLIGLTGCWFYSQEINILALGEEEAKNLGVDVNKVRWRLFLCIALLTGGSIASVGFIAFFGLVLPHLLRYVTGPDNRRLVPLCILAGATILLCMDMILRVMEIRAFTIGNLSAILGGIFFLFLLGSRRKIAC